MKALSTLAVAALALGFVAAKAPTHKSTPTVAPAKYEVIGAKMPMPDFFGSILTTR